MKRKTLFIIGMILISGAVVAASALSQTSGNEMAIGSDENECSIEMMDNMKSDSELESNTDESNTDYSMEDCGPEIMQSGNCGVFDLTIEECSSMIGTDMISESDHCDDMDAMIEDREINPKTKSF